MEDDFRVVEKSEERDGDYRKECRGN